MTSIATIEANRRNAQHSTGPRTRKGKATASENALTHGLTARMVTLPGEDPQAYGEYRNAIHTDLNPVGTFESELVDRIVTCSWRLRRAGYIEASVFRHQVFDQDARRARRQAEDLEVQVSFTTESMKALTTAFTDPEAHAALVAQAAACDAQRDGETLATTLVADATSGNALSKLSRYEASIERSLYRALHELQRLQAARQGRTVSTPAVVDITMNTPAE